MKKTMYAAFAIFIIVISFLGVYNYSLRCDNFYMDGMQKIKIEKKDNQSAEQFVADLENLCKELGCDISYTTYGNIDGERLQFLYKTSNTDDFYNITVEGGTQRLEKNQCFSSKEAIGEYETKAINGLWLNDNFAIMNFDLIAKYSLNDATYSVKGDTAEDILSVLGSKGYNVNFVDENLYAPLQDIGMYFRTGIIPFAIMIVCFVFYFLFNGKSTTLKKMDGYSSSQIRMEEYRRNLPRLLFVFLAIQIINYVIIAVVLKNGFIDYFINTISAIAIAFLLSVLIFIFCSSIISFQKNVAYIKGKSHKKLSLTTLLVLKIVFSIFVIINLSYVIMFSIYAYSSYNCSVRIAEATNGYAQLSMNSQSGDIFSDGGFNSITEKCFELYDDTVDKLDGVLLYTENYGQSISNDGTFAESTRYANYITANENYLKINPICKPNGEYITDEDFDDSKYNFLVSEKDGYYTPETILTLREDCDLDKDVNVIFYKADSEINTFSSQNGLTSNGKLDNPMIEIYTPDKDFYGNIMSYVAGHYFIKTTTDNPYEELFPYIKKVGLDNILTDTPLVSTAFLNTLEMFSRIIFECIVTAMLYLIGCIVLTLFCIKNYFLIYKDVISVKKLNGYNLWSIHKMYFVLIGIVNLLVLIIALYNKYVNMEQFNPYVYIGIVAADIIGFVLISKTYTRKNILEILKGN